MYADGIARGGDKTFAVYQHADGTRQEVSYHEIGAEADRLKAVLSDAGLKKGDRIAVISAMRPWWYSLVYACLQNEYIMVCIDPGIPMQHITKMMRDTEVRAVFTTLPSVVLPEEVDGYIPVYSIAPGFPLMSECSKVDILLNSCSPLPEDTFFILFSSGTTGENRKGVLLPHTTITMGIEYGMSTDAGIYKSTSAYTPRDCDLMLFPPYHVAGLLCATYDIYCNTKIIMLERLTPNALVSVLQELRPDNICTVPSMLTTLKNKIVAGYSKNLFLKVFIPFLLSLCGFLRRSFGWKVGRRLLRSLNKSAFGGNMRGFMIGASPCDEETMAFFLNMGIDVSMAYGLTELGAPLAVTGQGYYPGTTGRVLRHTDKMDIRIVSPDETGRGQVEVLSPYRMISYLREEDMEGCFTDDGYFRTGDLGYFDKDNCLVICGRAKEVIVLRNGEKLLPEEIEKKYAGIDGITELSVFRVPGEGGCDAFSIAAVKDRARGLPDEAMRMRIIDRAANIELMYRPEEVYIIPAMPLSSSHKVQRFRLTEMAVAGSSAPVTEASLRAVDEDEVVSQLRELLVQAGGAWWKSAELNEGTLLNLDSLSLINLVVSVQDKFGIDLFQLASAPETFGALVDAVKNFSVIDKTTKEEFDLSQFPQPVTESEKIFYGGVEKMVKLVWNVHGYGQENIPADDNFLLCSNHRTVLDPGFISSVLPRKIVNNTCIIGKSDLINDKILKDFVRSHNIIPVDRTGNSMLTLTRCRELLEEGWNILVFPEGTNYENATQMLPLKEGPVRLSIATGKPIVPVHITGLAHMDSEKTSFALPPTGGRIEIRFGKPIYPFGKSPAELNEVLRDAIESLV